jgi:hypothetical protein
MKAVPPIDWGRLLAVLDTLGVETMIPPQYSNAITDAGDLIVEVRRGSVYRSYFVNAPSHRADSVARRAARIAFLVDSLGAGAPR